MSTKKRAAKKVAINYQNGKIYKIVNDVNDIIYIGSTTQTLPKRFYSHKTMSRDGPSKFYIAVRDIGINHFQIVLIELFPCTCKAELEAREYAVVGTHDKAKVYNTTLDGTHCEETKAKIKQANKEAAKFGKEHHNFTRGSISPFHQPRSQGFMFTWRENGKMHGKGFSYGTKRTKEEAYQACVDLRNQIYPLDDKNSDEPLAE